MSVSALHLLRQGPVVKAMLQAATRGSQNGKSIESVAVPVPVLTDRVPPRHPDLIRDYIRNTGGSPGWYRGILPGHFFPQWGFPLLSQTLADVPYDLRRMLNAGCRIEMRAPLPSTSPLLLEAQLVEMDDNDRRTLFTERLTTGTADVPGAVIGEVTAIVPKRSDKKGPKKQKPQISQDAREIHQWRVGPTSGLDFVMLTGDINPIHWLSPYARLSGFKNTILHGFAMSARVIESLNRQLFCGDSSQLATVEMRFVRPLVLPAKVGVFIDSVGGVFVGHAPGGPAYLTGSYTTRQENKS